MNDWHNFFNRVDDNLANSTYRIFEEQHKAEILDWFSREDVAKEQKEDFIQALVEFKDDCGDFYSYRAYLLAAEAINYFKDCSRGDAIALQILKWSYAYFRQDKQDWQIVPQPLIKAARLTLELTDRQRVIAAFVHLVHTTPSRYTLHIAAEKLGELDPGNKSAIAALVLLLQVTQDDCTVLKITRSLIQIGSDNPAVVSNLVKLISANTDGLSNRDDCWYTIRDATNALAKVGLGNEIVINALVQLIQIIETTTDRYDIAWDVKVRAVKTLAIIAEKDEVVINALIELTKIAPDRDDFLFAVVCLGEIALGNQEAIASLTEFLQINQGRRDCLDAAKALWQIDEGNVNAMATLLQIVAVDERIWSDAADYLLEIAPKNVDVIYAFTEMMTATNRPLA